MTMPSTPPSAPPSAPPPTMKTTMTTHRLEELRRRLVGAWEATQVELHGHYSVENLRRFARYSETTGLARVAAVCLLTPAPLMAAVVLVDLLPLEPPSVGTTRSAMVWSRAFLTVLIITVGVLEQFRQHIAGLDLGRGHILLIALLAAGASVCTCFNLSRVVGYPLPFAMVIGTGPWFLVLVLALFGLRREQLRTNPSVARNLLRYLYVFLCQIAMTVVYPLYNHAFTTLSANQQTAFVFVLPLLKIIAKNWISRALVDADDDKPEAVIFNIEIFHSLFVSLCMQNSTSYRTIAALMLIDFAQAWISFRDVLHVLEGLTTIADKLDAARARTHSATSCSRRALGSLVQLAENIADVEPHLAAVKPRRGPPLKPVPSRVRLTSRFPKGSWKSLLTMAPTTRIVPVPTSPPSDRKAVDPQGPRFLTLPSDLAALNVVERGVLVRATQKLLYISEYIILIEYTEVIMPLVYNFYLVVMYQLPNREYYPFLRGVSPVQLSQTITKVTLYGSLELVSLVAMALLIWRTLRLSLLHQLAFVLERRQANVQAKLVLWIFYIMQNTIIQLGADYSFQFAWLRKSPPTSTPPSS